MAHIDITIDGRQWFASEVEGFHQPPPLPDSPSSMQVTELPAEVRDLLDQMMLKALERVGIKVTEYERVEKPC